MGLTDLHIHTIYSYYHESPQQPRCGRIVNWHETHNTTVIDKMSNHCAHILGAHVEIAKLGSKFLASTFSRLTNAA